MPPARMKIGPLDVSPTHLAGTVALFFTLVLYILAMWSPQWSVWEGAAGQDGEAFEEERSALRYYNGPWTRSCDKGNKGCNSLNKGYKESDSIDMFDIWYCGTAHCDHFVYVEDDCLETEGFNRCEHHKAVRIFTCIGLVLGTAAFILSFEALFKPSITKYACLGSCLLALITALCIFLAICLWAAIKDWDREQMRTVCSWDNYRDDNDGSKDDYSFSCWGETGTAGMDDEDPCNDDCDDIDPPYGLSWAFALCLFTIPMWAVSGLLVASDEVMRLFKK